MPVMNELRKMPARILSDMLGTERYSLSQNLVLIEMIPAYKTYLEFFVTLQMMR